MYVPVCAGRHPDLRPPSLSSSICHHDQLHHFCLISPDLCLVLSVHRNHIYRNYTMMRFHLSVVIPLLSPSCAPLIISFHHIHITRKFDILLLVFYDHVITGLYVKTLTLEERGSVLSWSPFCCCDRIRQVKIK